MGPVKGPCTPGLLSLSSSPSQEPPLFGRDRQAASVGGVQAGVRVARQAVLGGPGWGCLLTRGV